jgi:Uma2 family endonuclease
MTFTPTKTLTLNAFIDQYGEDPRYELADGELIDLEPTGSHETVGGKLANRIGMAILEAQHPWVIPRNCLIRPFSDIATARRPDIVVLDETLLSSEPRWEQELVITLGRTIKLAGR